MIEELIFEILYIFPTFDEKISSSFKKTLKEIEEEKLYIFNFSFGNWICDNFLNVDSKLYNIFIQYGIEDKRKMSYYILRIYWGYLQ